MVLLQQKCVIAYCCPSRGVSAAVYCWVWNLLPNEEGSEAEIGRREAVMLDFFIIEFGGLGRGMFLEGES